MNQILSQSEVDALLAAVTEGEVPAGGAGGGAGGTVSSSGFTGTGGSGEDRRWSVLTTNKVMVDEIMAAEAQRLAESSSS